MSEAASKAVGKAAARAPVVLRGVSKWYGQVLGVTHIDLEIGPGVVALLGPNGAGKSTLMKLIAGLLLPSNGEVLVAGRRVADDPAARASLGYCPEHEGMYDALTGLEFVAMMARLSGIPRAQAAERAAEALRGLGLSEAMTRPLGGYSKGMRQRAKLAQAMVHDPQVLLLDEPLTGCDPVARADIVRQVEALGAAGKTVLVSSHILPEVEAMTRELVLIHQGKIRARGNVGRIRALIDAHPHRIEVRCERARELAQALIAAEHITRIEFGEGTVVFETHQPDACYDAVARAALDTGVELTGLSSPDDNLQAVFAYLTESPGAEARARQASGGGR
ncbi:ABC transporter ATP-binding protein [Haliangium ochraceum]|uniref:ABC transporter related protein n=1 Tax=Haliangium ochraceum (strain DSM 14365 / JCM 11303 / SMP-2) TaxID=502025 RepID=D0LHU9_HALO1|nr:ABC transporter ATP-binding protein [Haliangium ochraceum]ACY14778.1 ABC transporter related protein [Haliangium ochraceum DSM 14365]